MPNTNRERLLKRAQASALNRGDSHIGVVHLLHALVSDGAVTLDPASGRQKYVELFPQLDADETDEISNLSLLTPRALAALGSQEMFSVREVAQRIFGDPGSEVAVILDAVGITAAESDGLPIEIHKIEWPAVSHVVDGESGAIDEIVQTREQARQAVYSQYGR
jgi:hypothetical protein